MSEPRLYHFSFREHEFQPPDGDDSEQAFLQMVMSQEWAPYEEQGPNAVSTYGGETDLDALEENAREVLIRDAELPEVLARLPFDKLRKLMARDGLAFVGGTFFEFEGNHNDTEFYAVLKKA